MKVKEVVNELKNDLNEFIVNFGDEDTFDNSVLFVMIGDEYISVDMDNTYFYFEDDGTVVLRINDYTDNRALFDILNDYEEAYYKYCDNQTEAYKYQRLYNDMYECGYNEENEECHSYAISMNNYQDKADKYMGKCTTLYNILCHNFNKEDYDEDLQAIHNEYNIEK